MVNLDNVVRMKQGKQSFCVTLIERKRWGPVNYFIYGVFDHGWCDLQLKYFCLCFGFFKTQVPDTASRDLQCDQHWHVTIDKSKKKSPLIQCHICPCNVVMKIKEVFKMFQRNKFLRRKERLLQKRLHEMKVHIKRKEKNDIMDFWESNETFFNSIQDRGGGGG